MARARNRRPAARRNPRRLDTPSGQERGDPFIRLRKAIDALPAVLTHATAVELVEASIYARAAHYVDIADHRIALRRKLNGDTR